MIGASVAYRLTQAGASVTLVEAGKLARGTSSTSFAWINANNKPPFEYHRLNVGGMSEHSVLRQEFGSAPWLHLHGNVIWEDSSTTQPKLSDRIKRLRSWSYPVEVLSVVELAELHPDLAPPPEVEEVAYFPAEGYIDPPLLIATLVRTARDLGARVELDQQVIGIVQEAGRVVGVRIADGDQLSADMVVSCVGRWTDQLSELTGIKIPMAPTLGLLAISSPAAVGLQALAHTPQANVRPDGSGRVMMASVALDPLLKLDDSEERLNEIAQQVHERATCIVPALAGSHVEAVRLGIRAIPDDGFPVVGQLSGLDGFYVIATHSGATLAPMLARIATKEILTGQPDERVSTFRPDRLISPQLVTA